MTGSRFLVITLMLLGVLVMLVGIIYLTEPAKSLPTFFPGSGAPLQGRHTLRGLVGIIVGAALIFIAAVTAWVSRRASRS